MCIFVPVRISFLCFRTFCLISPSPSSFSPVYRTEISVLLPAYVSPRIITRTSRVIQLRGFFRIMHLTYFPSWPFFSSRIIKSAFISSAIRYKFSRCLLKECLDRFNIHNDFSSISFERPITSPQSWTPI